MSARGERNAGTIGDILVQRAIVRGASAIVTDGGVRDAAQEREERFILDQVLAGASVDGLYPMNAAWRARYEASDDSPGAAPPA